MVYSKENIIEQIKDLGIGRNDTLLIHSSMKSIGEVKNGAETILDAFIEYLSEGLLIFPTHTWATIDEKNCTFNPLTEPSCVGILSNLFMKRQGVFRSLHPILSVAALGKGAKEYVSGEENTDTPCSRNGCLGKLYEMEAKILFIGCGLRSNTIIHGVEEWNQVPKRLTDDYIPFIIHTPDGRFIDRPMRVHDHSRGDISENYGKIEEALLKNKIAHIGKIGEAKTYYCDVRKMVDLVSIFLKRNPDLFGDKNPVPSEWY